MSLYDRLSKHETSDIGIGILLLYFIPLLGLQLYPILSMGLIYFFDFNNSFPSRPLLHPHHLAKRHLHAHAHSS